MSRIGSTPISIPENVSVSVELDRVVVKGPKGELAAPLPVGVTVAQAGDQLLVKRSDNQPQSRANHGLVRSLLYNHVLGVTQGFKKTLKLVGTGYRAAAKGDDLSLTVGFSHPVEIRPLAGVKLQVEGQDTVHVEGIDKQKVGQQAADIRAVRPPEPYKGKGIRYQDEQVRRKQGKAAL
ncbi:MAG: 50S ribosomal protein L6 [Candidatus Pacebacteria bacterium CG10_big_fil_rev_8_21_14_0_10_56_10]|nr:MAG: 50S ribosomal protein L6 [Candidatus Pacebacteria bacterium CG10_big_fil_rev_8_21_14_0_10_56_10]